VVSWFWASHGRPGIRKHIAPPRRLAERRIGRARSVPLEAEGRAQASGQRLAALGGLAARCASADRGVVLRARCGLVQGHSVRSAAEPRTRRAGRTGAARQSGRALVARDRASAATALPQFRGAGRGPGLFADLRAARAAFADCGALLRARAAVAVAVSCARCDAGRALADRDPHVARAVAEGHERARRARRGARGRARLWVPRCPSS
jgi:hypothetical protein